ncbi:AAA family ATPase [Curtobacterium sp. VKM Ac-1395]|uniref:AAA family ATPase n=1 Tax=Curtobacterium sp. VKM Ac-1395 TaxID=2783815 RepID=UPI00188AD2CA|nr:AAA family ATPase [Curtobacterium sp. VKM Ac-1395]MBF4590696.1 AAA family ATPase [Curtobacterium sp. VKM Ac-1395]
MAQTGDWHIDRLELTNFRGFEHLNIDFHPSLTVLVGVNGVGKTAVLDAVAIMLGSIVREFGGDTRGFAHSDVRETARDLLSQGGVASMDAVYPVSALVEATVAGAELWWSRSRQRASGRTTWADRNGAVGDIARATWERAQAEAGPTQPLPILALYGVERLLGVRKASGSITRARSSAYDAALTGKSDLTRLSAYLRALTLAEFAAERRGGDAEAATEQIRAITIAADRVLEGTGWHRPEWSPVVEELTLTHDDQSVLPLSLLSSGIKIAVGLVVDLVSRLARANPHLGAEQLLESALGIVLIDEVDLHLHPTWQQRIVPQLRTAFPRVQFIVTTHSPQVLSTVDAEHIRIIDGQTIRRVDYSAGLRSDIVMEKVLGTQAEPNLEVNKTLAKYMDLVENGAGQEAPAVRLRQQLDEELGGVSNVPKLSRADASMTFYGLGD